MNVKQPNHYEILSFVYGLEVSHRQKTILDCEGSAIKSHEINADKWNKNRLLLDGYRNILV